LDKTKKSLEIARQRIESAEYLLKINQKFNHYIIVDAYNSMFHAARALLYRDGIQEKNHYAVFVYLKEKYSSKIPLNIINLLNIYRIERHEAVYGLEYRPTKEDAKSALEDARLFIKEIEKQIG
ncbi:MAG: HEPN domain-containing protein, partial [Nanoarchaeota archaeon]